VPGGIDQNIYLVIDDFGRLGRVWREADVENTDLETVIQNMLRGEYSNPVGVFGFNPFEGWSRDVSEDVAQEIRRRCDLQAEDVSAQNLYGQAKDAARDATDATVSYAKDAYENSGDTFRDGSQALTQKVQDNPLGALLVAGCIGFALAMLMTRPPSRSRHLR
jgi:ElaB/YqjD/DUF883 family membrane-anchored ribosome-binding protein